MKKAKIIAIVGSHYVGKTVLCKELVDYLGSKEFSVGTIGEVARECPDDINEIASVEAQDWILGKQIEREEKAIQNHAIVIADRGVIDNFAYRQRVAEKNNLEKNLIEEKEQEIFRYSRNYDIIFFLQPFEVEKIEDDNFRSVNLEWRKEMHDRVSHILNKFQNSYNVPIFPLSGNKKDVFKQAKKILKNHLSIM